jgi:hypothetical protein
MRVRRRGELRKDAHKVDPPHLGGVEIRRIQISKWKIRKRIDRGVGRLPGDTML